MEHNEEQRCFVRANIAIRQVVLVRAIETVTELGILNVLAAKTPGGEGGRKLSAKEIAAELGIANPDSPKLIDAFLGVMACYDLVGCSLSAAAAGETRLYSLNAVSNYFLPPHLNGGVSVKPMLSMFFHPNFWDSMSEAKNAILKGGVAFERATGMSYYAYMEKDQEFKQHFNDAMSSYSIATMNDILEGYDGFKDLETLVDVGGNSGITISMIISKYPFLKGINFDLPHVVQQAPSYTGVEHIGGDFLQGVPKGDAILLKFVLHNWSDDQCIKLLKNCYDSIPNGGKVMIIETLVHAMPDTSDPVTLSFINNVVMSVLFDGGQKRTREEFKALAAKAGFNGVMRFLDFIECNVWILELFK